MSIGIIQTALEVGFVYSLVALSLFVSFSILDICDLSTDGCYTLGCAVGAMATIAGHPILGVGLAILAGIASGLVTATLQTRFGVQSILAGIIVNTGLYTVNLAVMGFSSNVSIFAKDTVFSLFGSISSSDFWHEWSDLILLALVVGGVGVVLWRFLGTRLGLSIRATGDSPAMVRASSINPEAMVTLGLCIGGALTGLAGCLIGQFNKTCDINLGTGMVTVALASLVIGETLTGQRSIPVRIAGVVGGSVLYRLFIALALRMHVPTEAFKLVSAAIVAVAIVLPRAKELWEKRRARVAAMELRRAHVETLAAEGAAPAGPATAVATPEPASARDEGEVG